MSIDNEKILFEKDEKNEKISVFLEELKKKSTIEEKVGLCLELMRTSLSQKSNPDFKAFWEAKNKCLALFKEEMSQFVREKFWEEHIQLSEEAASLKEVINEEAAFAKEQIAIAINALMSDLKNLEPLLKATGSIQFPENLQCNLNFYQKSQGELNIINVISSRIHSLRKEVIQTKIRFKEKHDFFNQLSALGDIVYPRRKELIQSISETFEADVNEFIAIFFSKEAPPKIPYFKIKDMIKSFQTLAKLLSLHLQAFSSTRLKLSTCWDQIKTIETEKRKEFSEKKSLFETNRVIILDKINALKKKAEDRVDSKELLKELSEVQSLMRSLELAHVDVKDFKNSLKEIESVLSTKKTKEEEVKKKKQTEVKENIQSIKVLGVSLIKDEENYDSVYLEHQMDLFKSQMQSEKADKGLKKLLEYLLETLQAVILKKNLLSMHSDTLEECEEVLEKSLDLRDKIKSRIVLFRKTSGGSMMDFETSFFYQELIECEKKSLLEIENLIEKIEDMITELE